LKKQFAVFLVMMLTLTASLVSAVEFDHQSSWGIEFAYYADSHKGKNAENGFEWPDYSPEELPSGYLLPAGDEGRDLGSGWGSVELQAYYDHTMTMPFTQGTGALTKDNNVKFSFRAYLAPVVTYVQARATYTPIAFLNFQAGTSFGTGWPLIFFNGVGLNNDGSGNPAEDPFPGLVLENWLAGTFQFDLAALVPGKWNHVVTVANAMFKYSNFTAADNDEAWQWKADDGENFNGLQYIGTYVLGYQMPLKVDMVGMLVETTQYLGDAADLSKKDAVDWNSGFVKVVFGPLASITFDEHNTLTALLQFKTDKKYTDETIHDNFFRNREYESTYVKIHRLALSYKHTF